MMRRSLALAMSSTVLVYGVSACAQTLPPVPPTPREMRAVWVATVANIDWPSEPGLPVARQKSELLAILDKAVAMRLNAIVLQVRPACDALYRSSLEPWSEYLTGKQGAAPDPPYDPLEFAVTESHKRGLELHAWFNPFRSRHPSAKSPVSSDHISKRKPAIVRSYGKHLWLDPGEQGTQDHSYAVMMDVVKRYDVDGIHMDDYFYPYKEQNAAGKVIDFPDDASYARYRDGGGTLARDDWRRRSVDTFIERLYAGVKKAKPWVRVGISPFGIWRPGNPAQIKGFDAYAEIYADSKKWLENGWVDYFTPQLYWPIAQAPQSFPVLLDWWMANNPHRRPIWPGQYTSRVADGSRTQWAAKEIEDQIKETRSRQPAPGTVHFSMKAFLRNQGGVTDRLSNGVYAKPALAPSFPWLKAAPAGKLALRRSAGQATFTASGSPPWLWTVWKLSRDGWSLTVTAGGSKSISVSTEGAMGIAVRAVNRVGEEGPSTMWFPEP